MMNIMWKNFSLVLSVLILISCLVAVNPVDAENPVEDLWQTKAPMNRARSDFGTVAVDGKIYAIGGSISGSWGVKAVGATEEYNPTTNTWTIKSDMPTPRANFAIAAYKNLIYCIGGVVGMETINDPVLNGLEVQRYVKTNAIEVYDTITGTWERKNNALFNDIVFCQSHTINDSIYIMRSGNTYVYNVSNDSWIAKSKLPNNSISQNLPVSTVVDDKIIVAGLFENPDRAAQLYIYDPATDNWTQSTSCPFTSIVGIAATTGLKAPKLVYVFGSNYPDKLVNQAYDIEKDTWTKAAYRISECTGFGVAVVNDLIYAIGGGKPTNINEQYTPIGYSTPPTISFTETQTRTYNQSTIPLNFTLDRAVNWTGYSIDSQDNVTFTGNLTLTGLSNGAHNLTIYANDTYGSMSVSETRYFTVDVPAPFPIEFGVIAVVIVGVIFVVFVLFYKRTKSKQSPV
jgi:hypothetical protein